MNPPALYFMGFSAVMLGSQGFSNPSRKTWWSKRLRSDLFHTAGRLTERQIKYASESGFKTLISLFTYDTDVGDAYFSGGNYLPSTDKSRYIAERLCGIRLHALLKSGANDWKNNATVQHLHDIVRKSKKPILFFSDKSYAATFLLLLHFANITEKEDVQLGEPSLSRQEVFQNGAQLGFHYETNNKLIDLMFNVIGDVDPTPFNVSPDIHSEKWYQYYWQMKPVYENVFISGQIQEHHLANIKSVGIVSVVNTRRGLTNLATGHKLQEEVTLLNIKDRTGTYTGNGRQSVQQLQLNRIHPNKPKVYISDSSLVNYDTNNTGEFGDHIGYNERIERNSIRRIVPSIEYFHLPIGGRYGYDKMMWKAYKKDLQKISNKGIMLLQCRTGARSATLGILWSAYNYCFNSTWALQKGQEIGYNLAEDSKITVLFQEVLDNRPGCIPLGKSSLTTPVLHSLILLCLTLYEILRDGV